MVFQHNINPVLLNIVGIEIRYYGLIYIIALVLAYFIISYLAKLKKLHLKKDDVLDLIIYMAFGVLLGGRIFYFIFYNFGDIITDPLELFRLWHGGMSYHGGLIGVFFAILIYSKVKKVHFYDLADMIAIPAALGIALGRIGNFINGELIGRPTNLPWSFNFGDGISRHPSQLYQSIANFINFGILWQVKNFKLPRGFLFWFYITLYGGFRFSTEFFREPDPQVGFVLFNFFTMGQILSLIMAVAGGVMLYITYSNNKKI